MDFTSPPDGPAGRGKDRKIIRNIAFSVLKYRNSFVAKHLRSSQSAKDKIHCSPSPGAGVRRRFYPEWKVLQLLKGVRRGSSRFLDYTSFRSE